VRDQVAELLDEVRRGKRLPLVDREHGVVESEPLRPDSVGGRLEREHGAGRPTPETRRAAHGGDERLEVLELPLDCESGVSPLSPRPRRS
jgi:hypothetical protein